jgi:hypothetical protein
MPLAPRPAIALGGDGFDDFGGCAGVALNSRTWVHRSQVIDRRINSVGIFLSLARCSSCPIGASTGGPHRHGIRRLAGTASRTSRRASPGHLFCRPFRPAAYLRNRLMPAGAITSLRCRRQPGHLGSWRVLPTPPISVRPR